MLRARSFAKSNFGVKTTDDGAMIVSGKYTNLANEPRPDCVCEVNNQRTFLFQLAMTRQCPVIDSSCKKASCAGPLSVRGKIFVVAKKKKV